MMEKQMEQESGLPLQQFDKSQFSQPSSEFLTIFNINSIDFSTSF